MFRGGRRFPLETRKRPRYVPRMKPMPRLSVIEQTANHLRQGICEIRWGGRFPGVPAITRECEVSANVARAAVRLLEAEGWLEPAGHGRRRRIASAKDGATSARILRVGIFLREPMAGLDPGFHDALLQIVHRLEESGHAVFFAPKTQTELSHSLPRLKRMVEEQQTDAWIVVDGTKAFLSWFAERKAPTLAIGGQIDDLPISTVGPHMMPAGRAAMQRLIELGHRRVVLICTCNERAGAGRPDHTVGAALSTLAACGVKISPFNLPEWDETPAGLQTLLHALFRVTPPTALVIMRPTWATGVLSFLASRGLRVPQQVSIVGYGLEALNPWHSPALAYLCAEDVPVVRRTVRWVRQVARGVTSPRHFTYPGVFVDGPSIGPAPR